MPILLAATLTLPSVLTVIIGFNLAKLPIAALVALNLPPLHTYSRVSTEAMILILLFRLSSSSTISLAL